MQNSLKNLLKGFNHLGVAALAVFSTLGIEATFGLSIHGVFFLLFSLAVGGFVFIGTASVYRDNPVEKLKAIFFPGEEEEKLKLTKRAPMDTIGLISSFLKAVIAGVGTFISLYVLFLKKYIPLGGDILTCFTTPELLPFILIFGFIAVGISVASFMVQQTKLVPEARKWVEKQSLKTKREYPPFKTLRTSEKLTFCLKMPLVVLHALGQFTPAFYIVFKLCLLLNPSSLVALAVVVPLAAIGAGLVGATTGGFYGRDFLYPGRDEKIETGEKISWNTGGVILGGGCAFFKGALAFVCTITSTAFITTALAGMGIAVGAIALTTPPGWLIAAAVIIGLGTWAVQSYKMIPRTSQFIRDKKKALLGKGEDVHSKKPDDFSEESGRDNELGRRRSRSSRNVLEMLGDGSTANSALSSSPSSPQNDSTPPREDTVLKDSPVSPYGALKKMSFLNRGLSQSKCFGSHAKPIQFGMTDEEFETITLQPNVRLQSLTSAAAAA